MTNNEKKAIQIVRLVLSECNGRSEDELDEMEENGELQDGFYYSVLDILEE